MIKRALCGLSMAVLVLGFTTACGKKDEVLNTADTPGNGDNPALSVVGHWLLVATTSNTSNSESPSSENTSHIYSFDANNNMTYSQMFSGSKQTGTFSHSGSTLVVNFPGGAVTSNNITLSADEMILPDSNPSISTIKQRKYKRISEQEKDALIQKYNVK